MSALPKFDAVLFDCDGVLVDSEGITNTVLCQRLNALGWPLNLSECMAIFVGTTVIEHKALIFERTGYAITSAWLDEFKAERNAALGRDLQIIPNAQFAVQRLHSALQGRLACASGADRFKVRLQLDKVGLLPYFDAHIYSGQEQPSNKPAPDVYWAAAKGLGVDPTRCLVIEDTPTGARAGLAAGATVWGYCAQGHGRAFAGVPLAGVFHSMTELPKIAGLDVV
jgi:HAD superfamily hydrolase (TIGR01509 family)